jgi:hypothetical protein
LQLLGLEHHLHLQLLDVQHLPFLIAQDLIWVSACLLPCQDGHSQQVYHHHSYLREYMAFILHTVVLDMDSLSKKHTRYYMRCQNGQVYISRKLLHQSVGHLTSILACLNWVGHWILHTFVFQLTFYIDFFCHHIWDCFSHSLSSQWV